MEAFLVEKERRRVPAAPVAPPLEPAVPVPAHTRQQSRALRLAGQLRQAFGR